MTCVIGIYEFVRNKLVGWEVGSGTPLLGVPFKSSRDGKHCEACLMSLRQYRSKFHLDRYNVASISIASKCEGA